MSLTDIPPILLLIFGGTFIGFLSWRLWVERPSRQSPRRDISCPDCGKDPHRPDCDFAWLGPPPTDFILLDLEQDSEQP